MVYRSGLAAQFGFVNETTVGTEVTVTKFAEFKNDTLESDVSFQESEGLKTGTGFMRRARVAPTRYSAKGDVELELADRNLGLLLAQAVGGTSPTPVQIGATGAYNAYFNPGDQVGKSLTVQVGKPRVNSVTPLAETYRGMKIPSYEISCSDDGFLTLKLSFDGWRRTGATAMATASFPTGMSPFRANEAVVTMDTNGTPVLSSSQVNLSGSAVTFGTILKNFSFKVNNPMDTERFGIGNAGTKSEQLENAIPTATLDFEVENGSGTGTISASTFLETAGTILGMVFEFSHGDAGGGNAFKFRLALPSLQVKTHSTSVSGPDLIRSKISAQCYDPEITGIGAYQIATVNNQSTL